MTKLPIVLTLCLVLLHAGPIDFSGSASIYAEYDSIQGAPQGRPQSTIRFNLNPTLTIYGMPISLNLYLTSVESSFRQAVNKFRLLLEPAKLARDMVNVPGFVFKISFIEIGTSYPYYSPLTLSGIPVTGGGAEMNPWILYLAATGGRVQRGVVGSDTTDAAYERMIYAGRFGIGKKNKSHLFFTLLYASDDTSSIPPYTFPVAADTDTVSVITPKENYLAGVELKLSLFKGRFTLESEVAGSQLTRDVRMPEVNIHDIPSWIANITHPRMSTSFDYAYSVKSNIDIFDTKISGSVKVIGPGFSSLGVPNLRNDIFSYSMGISRRFLNNSISISASHIGECDNLINSKQYTTCFLRYAFNIGVNFRNLPYLQVGYTPYFQYNDVIDCRNDMILASTGYNFTVLDIDNSPSLSFYYQRYDDISNEKDYDAYSIYLYENLNFKFPLYISAGAGLTNTNYSDTVQNILSFDVSASYTFLRRWKNTLGLKMAFEEDRGRKNGIYFKSSLPFWVFGNMNFSVERNVYLDEYDDENDYEEWRLRGTLSKNW